MVRGTDAGFLAELGLTVDDENLYWQVLGHAGRAVDDVAAWLRRTPAELDEALRPLRDLGAVEVVDGRLEVRSLTDALAGLLEQERAVLAAVVGRLEAVARGVAFAGAAADAAPVRDVSDDHGAHVAGRVVDAAHIQELLVTEVRGSTGDLLWLVSDQWREPWSPELVGSLHDAVRAGRRSRGIFPVHVLDESPEVLEHMVRQGHQVRVLPRVPTRLSVFGLDSAVIPELPGYASPRRVLVQERGLVMVLAAYFEQLWERATALPELDRSTARPDLRRLLLQEMATGAKDEQVARNLGLSLRTVRRRVADLQIELGADSRFQAGVEAVRRGWV